MSLFAERKRERDRLEDEARGEVLWVDYFSSAARNKLWHAMVAAAGSAYAVGAIASAARTLLLADEGLKSLKDMPGEQSDLVAYWDSCGSDQFASCVEAVFQGMLITKQFYASDHLDFARRVREIFARERAAFDFSDEGEMIPIESRELHAEVIAPTLRLLASGKGLEAAEDAYQDAIRELARNEPADAITDAARALEETLRAKGAIGNSLGPLLTSAKKLGVLSPHDTRLTDLLSTAVEWVSADRAVMGDAHKSGALTREDGWLTVHVVGALIVRLVAGDVRSSQRVTGGLSPD
jgi:hypothetical protein